MTDHRGNDGAGGAARPSAGFAEQALRELESGDGIFESAVGHRTSTLSSVLNQGEENDDEESSDDGTVTMGVISPRLQQEIAAGTVTPGLGEVLASTKALLLPSGSFRPAIFQIR